MRLYLLVTLVQARIARGKTCALENGYLNVIEGEKNQFIPTCSSGFALSESVSKVKCKKGELVPAIVCNSLTTSNPSTTDETDGSSTAIPTTNSLITDQSGCAFENGYLEHINGVKYKPKCQVGYELITSIIFLKCKNGKMDVTPVCELIQTSLTTSITVTDGTSTAKTTPVSITENTTSEKTSTSTTTAPVTLITPYPPPKPTDSSGCPVENGYLSVISGSKYTPICYSGFKMVPNVKTVKCKKGSLSQAINCVSIETSSTTTSTVPIVTTSETLTTISSTIESTETPKTSGTLGTSTATTTEFTTPVNTSGCTLENGYLVQIGNSNNYQPFCLPGFELSDTVESVKCNKKKKLNVKNLNCIQVVTTSVTSTSMSSTSTTSSITSRTVIRTTTSTTIKISTTISTVSTTQSSMTEETSTSTSTLTTKSATVTTTTTPTTSTSPTTTSTSTSTSSITVVTDQSGCKFDNGYLEHVTGTKYKPRCQTGYELKFPIKTIKCKNGVMNASPECISIGTTTTTSTSTTTSTTTSTITSSTTTSTTTTSTITTSTTTTSTTNTSPLTTGTTTSTTVFETTPYKSTTTEFDTTTIEFTTTIFETTTEADTTELSTTTYQRTTTRPRTSTSIEFTTTTLTTSGSTTTTELPTSTFMETRTTPPPDHTDPQRDCTNPYSISFDKVDAWEDGFVGLITIPKQALRLDNFGSEYTIIFDMKDENHEIDFETWNVKFYMNYYGTRGWVYHSQPGDEFDNSSFAFVMQNIPSGFSRKLVTSVVVKTRTI